MRLQMKNIILNSINKKVLSKTTAIAITLILFTILVSCQEIYEEETFVACFTKDFAPFRLRINFTVLVKNERGNREFVRRQNRLLVSSVKRQIRSFLLQYSLENDSSALVESIENASLNKLLKEHINKLSQFEKLKMKFVKICIVAP